MMYEFLQIELLCIQCQSILTDTELYAETHYSTENIFTNIRSFKNFNLLNFKLTPKHNELNFALFNM